MNGKHKSIRSVQSTPSFNNPSNEIDTSANLPRSVSGTLKPKGDTSNARTTTNPESDLNTKMHSSTQTQTPVDSVSSLYNSRAPQKTSDTLVLYDFPAAVLYKYPLHASLIPKDYDQCPRVSELLIQQSSMFVVARGKFQIYKVRGLDSDTELNPAGTAPLVPLTSPKLSFPNTLHSSDTLSKDSENKGPTDYSKTLSYLRCGHMVHPILPKMRIWKISKNMYILPQPSPKNFWRLEIELQNDELDVPELVDLDDLDEIWKETCYYQSIYVPPPSLPPATKSGNVKLKSLKTDEPSLQNPSHGSRNTEFQRLTKHFEKECEKNEERKEHAFKKRALQESKNAKPQNENFDQNVMPEIKGQYLDVDAKDELIETPDSDSEIWTNIKGLDSGNGLGLELAGSEESKETMGLQTNAENLDPVLEPCFDNENTLKPVKSQLTIPKKPHNLEDIYEENADQSQANDNFNANLVFDDPFGFPLNSPPHNKPFPESVLDAPQHFSPTFSSESSDQFASSPGSNLDFYLQQGHVSPTVSELFGTPTAGQHAQHAPNPGRRVSFSGSPTWSGYSSPVSRNSAISSSSTLDHILDAFEAPETRFGNHCHTVPSQNSAAPPNVQRPGQETSARSDKLNASSQSQSSVIGQLRNLGLSGLANFPNMTTLNFGSLSNNFRNFSKLSYSTTSLASPEVYLDEANEASGTVYTESTVSLDEQLLGNEKGKRFVNDDRDDTAYFCASVGSSAETLTDTKEYKPGTCDKATQTQVSSSFVLEDGALVLGSSSACHETASNGKHSIAGPSSSLTLTNSSARPTSSSGLLTIQDLTTKSALRHSRSHNLLGRRAFSSQQQQHPLANRIGFIGPITSLIASGQYSFPIQPLRPRRNSVGPTEIGHAGAVETLRRSTSQTNLSSTFFSSNLFFDQSLPASQAKPAFKRSVSLNALAIEDHDQAAPLGPGSRAAPVVGLLTPEKHAQLFDGTRKDIQEVQMKGARLATILKKQ